MTTSVITVESMHGPWYKSTKYERIDFDNGDFIIFKGLNRRDINFCLITSDESRVYLVNCCRG